MLIGNLMTKSCLLKLKLKESNASMMFKNFHNSLNSLEYQYSVTTTLTFKTRLHLRT